VPLRLRQELQHSAYHEIEARAVLRRVPQFAKGRSGGWIQSFPAQGLLSTGNRLLYAIGGNVEENFLLARHASYLSAIHAAVPSQPAKPDTVWSSGLRNPIACTATSTRISDIYCLLETITSTGRRNGTALFLLKPGNNYGSTAFQSACVGVACEQKYNAAYQKSALMLFEPLTRAILWIMRRPHFSRQHAAKH
jgi:hypothetical protein